MRLYAHRGYSARFPENTRSAFEAAFRHGADGVEADLQKCADGTLVILHDPELDRTTNLKGSLKTLGWAEVRNAKIAGNESVLKLEDLLAIVPRDRLLNLELKSDTITPDDLPAIAKTLQELRGTEGTMISCFSHDFLPTFRRAGFETAALLGDAHASRGVGRLLLDLARVRPRYINAPVQTFERLGPLQAGIFFRLIKATGIKLAFWTINRDQDWEKVRPYADALIGDDVERALAWLGRIPQPAVYFGR